MKNNWYKPYDESISNPGINSLFKYEYIRSHPEIKNEIRLTIYQNSRLRNKIIELMINFPDWRDNFLKHFPDYYIDESTRTLKRNIK